MGRVPGTVLYYRLRKEPGSKGTRMHACLLRAICVWVIFKGKNKLKPNKNGRLWRGERERMVREAGVEIRFL